MREFQSIFESRAKKSEHKSKANLKSNTSQPYMDKPPTNKRKKTPPPHSSGM